MEDDSIPLADAAGDQHGDLVTLGEPIPFTVQDRDDYFSGVESRWQTIGGLLTDRIREENHSPGARPRRILQEIATAGGFPVGEVQYVQWVLEHRGIIEWT